MKATLIRTTNGQERKQAELRRAIDRKRIILMKWDMKVQSLQMDLDYIRHEYTIRVGRLYLKDTQLDLEIIRLRNIIELLKNGLPYEDAIKEVDQKYYSEERMVHEQEEKINEESERFVPPVVDTETGSSDTLKTLWKKLLFQFHPDLTSDPDEKKRREDIMKKINKAYATQDITALQTIDQQEIAIEATAPTIEQLEKMLVSIENSILVLQDEYQQLIESEWFGWKKSFDKAKQKKTDIFLDLERNLLDDIVSKMKILSNLKDQTEQKEFL